MHGLDANMTIYVCEPWLVDSEALVAPEPDEGGVPGEAAARHMTYYLEVQIAQDFLRDWSASQGRPPSLEEQCARLTQYARYDA
jgi:hypothetical protein